MTRPIPAERAAAALLLAEGRSYREVERRTGIPRSTLHRWRRENGTFRDTVKAARLELRDLALALVNAAGGELLRRLDDPDSAREVDVTTLNRIFGTAADKLIALRRIEAPQRVEVAAREPVVTPEEIRQRRRQLLLRLKDAWAREGLTMEEGFETQLRELE